MATPNPIDYFPPVIRTKDFTGKNGFEMYASGYVEFLNSISVSNQKGNSNSPSILIGSYNASPFGRIEAGHTKYLKGGPNVGGNGIIYLGNISYPDGGNFWGAPLARTETTYYGQFSGFDVELGDFNHDGRLDAAIGATTADYTASNAGSTFVISDFLSVLAQNNGNVDLASCPNPNCTRIDGQPNDKLGWRVSKCDFLQTGFDDLCITSPFASFNGYTSQGAVNILRSRANMPATITMPINSTTVGYTVVSSQPSSINNNCGMGLAAVNGSMVFFGCPSASFGNRSYVGAVIGLFGPQNSLNYLQNISALNPATSLIIYGPAATYPFSNPFNYGIGQEIRDASFGSRLALGVNAPYSSPNNRTNAGTGFIVNLPRNGTLDLHNSTWGFSDGYKFIGANPGELWGSAIGSIGKFDSSNLPGYFITRYVPSFSIPTEITVGYIFPGGSNLLKTNSTIDLALVKPDGVNVIAINMTYQGYAYWTSISKQPVDYNGDGFHDPTIINQADFSNPNAVGSAIMVLGSQSPILTLNPFTILDDGTPVTLDSSIINVNSTLDSNSTFVTLTPENGYLWIKGSLTPAIQGTYNYSQIESGQIQLTAFAQKTVGLNANVSTVRYAFTPTQTANVTTQHVGRPPMLGQVFIRLLQNSNFLFNISFGPQTQNVNVLSVNLTNPDFYQIFNNLKLNISGAEHLQIGFGSPNSTQVVASVSDFIEGKIAGEVDNTGLPVSFTVEAINDYGQTNPGGPINTEVDTIFAPTLSFNNSDAFTFDQGTTYPLTSALVKITAYPGTSPNQVRAQINSISGGKLLDNGVPANSFTLEDQLNNVAEFADNNNDFGPRTASITVVDELYGLQSDPYNINLKTLFRGQIDSNNLIITQYQNGYIIVNGTRVGSDLSNCFLNFPPDYISNGNIFFNDTQSNLLPIYNVNATVADSQANRIVFSNTFGSAGAPTYAAELLCYTKSGVLKSDLSYGAVEFNKLNFMEVDAAGVSLLQGAATHLSALNFQVTDPYTPIPQLFKVNMTSVSNAEFSSNNPINQGGIPGSVFSLDVLQKNVYLNAGNGISKPVIFFTVCSQVTGYCVDSDVTVSWTLQPTTPVITQAQILTVPRGGMAEFTPDNINVIDRNTPPTNQVITASVNSACVILNNSTGTLIPNNVFPYSQILAANNSSPLIFLKQDGSLTPCTVSLLAYNGINYSQLFVMNIDLKVFYKPPVVSIPQLFLVGLGSTSLKDLTIASERPIANGDIAVTLKTSPSCYAAYRSDLTQPITVNGTANWLNVETPTIYIVSTSGQIPCVANISVSDAVNVSTPFQSLEIQFEPLPNVPVSATSFTQQFYTGLQITGLTTFISLIVWGVRSYALMAYNQKILKRAANQKTILSQEIVNELKDEYDLKKCGCLRDSVLARYYAGAGQIILMIQHAVKTDNKIFDQNKLGKIGAEKLAKIIVEEAVNVIYKGEANKGKLSCTQKLINFLCSTRDLHHKDLMKISTAKLIAEAVIARVRKECPDLLTDEYIKQNLSPPSYAQATASISPSFYELINDTFEELRNARSLTETTLSLTNFLCCRVCCKLTKEKERQYKDAISKIIKNISKVVKVDDWGPNRMTPELCYKFTALFEKKITEAIYGKFSWWKSAANYLLCRTAIPLEKLEKNIEKISDDIISEIRKKDSDYQDLQRDPFADENLVDIKMLIDSKENPSALTRLPGVIDSKEGQELRFRGKGSKKLETRSSGTAREGSAVELSEIRVDSPTNVIVPTYSESKDAEANREQLGKRFLELAAVGGSSSSPVGIRNSGMVAASPVLTLSNAGTRAANAAANAPELPAIPADAVPPLPLIPSTGVSYQNP